MTKGRQPKKSKGQRQTRARLITITPEKFDNFLAIRDENRPGVRLEKEVSKAIEAGEISLKDREAFVKFVTDTHNRLSPKKHHVTLMSVQRQLEEENG